MIKGALFDFNGTLFFDDDLHRMAWNQLFKEMTNNERSFSEITFKHNGGLRVPDIAREMLELLDIPYTPQKAYYLARQKEGLYHHYTDKFNRNNLSPGSEVLLNELKNRGIALNMVSMSISFSIDYYFKAFDLYRWFKPEDAVFDDSTFLEKGPQYLLAAERSGLTPDECVVFEDSPGNLVAAYNAGFKNLVAINSERRGGPGDVPVLANINNFEEFDINVLFK